MYPIQLYKNSMVVIEEYYYAAIRTVTDWMSRPIRISRRSGGNGKYAVPERM